MILKWIFDRVVSLLGLLILWPVLLIVAILVKVKMPGGPAFFVQKRVGKGGKLFDCHKFRTMTVPDGSRFSDLKVQSDQRVDDKVQSSRLAGETDNKKGGWSSVSVAGDSRITPLGAKLRHWKLDELPGLWDVLIGNMSFVGPRLADVRRLMSEGRYLPQEQIDKMPDQELAVWYNDNVIYPDKVRLNCYYYRHYSFAKDIQMILCTVLGKKMEYAGENF